MFYLGCVGDDVDPNFEDFPWETYWRSIFRKITDDDIREYELKYKGLYLVHGTRTNFLNLKFEDQPYLYQILFEVVYKIFH